MLSLHLGGEEVEAERGRLGDQATQTSLDGAWEAGDVGPVQPVPRCRFCAQRQADRD